MSGYVMSVSLIVDKISHNLLLLFSRAQNIFCLADCHLNLQVLIHFELACFMFCILCLLILLLAYNMTSLFYWIHSTFQSLGKLSLVLFLWMNLLHFEAYGDIFPYIQRTISYCTMLSLYVCTMHFALRKYALAWDILICFVNSQNN